MRVKIFLSRLQIEDLRMDVMVHTHTGSFYYVCFQSVCAQVSFKTTLSMETFVPHRAHLARFFRMNQHVKATLGVCLELCVTHNAFKISVGAMFRLMFT